MARSADRFGLQGWRRTGVVALGLAFLAVVALARVSFATASTTIDAQECMQLGFHSASLSCEKCDLLVGLPDDLVEQCRGCCDSEAGSGAAVSCRAVVDSRDCVPF